MANPHIYVVATDLILFELRLNYDSAHNWHSDELVSFDIISV